MRVPREALEFRAAQLFSFNPTWGRRKVAKALRDEFGGALRDATLDKIRKEIGSLQSQKERREIAQIRASQIFTREPNLTIKAAREKLAKEFGTPILSSKYYSMVRSYTRMNVEMVATIRSFEKKRAELIGQNIRIRANRIRYMVTQNLPDVDQETYRDRARYLSNRGFMRWEWQWLSYHNLDTPAMKRMMRDRERFVNSLIDKGLNNFQIEDRIIAIYKKNGWLFKDGRFNPFKLLEFYYRKDRDQQPADRTPEVKRRGGTTDFKILKRNTEEKDQFRFGI